MPHAPAARPDAIRGHNLGLLLGQVHRDGELTRAQLTQRLALSRSTIGALVADLTELGLVDERVPSGGARAGRPSHVVGPRRDGPYAIAVDIDVTHLTIAAVGIGGHVLSRHTLTMDPSPSPADLVAEHIVAEAAKIGVEVDDRARPIGIGISVPGTVDWHSGTVEFAPNLTWRHEDFGAMVAALAPPGLRVFVGNDADLAVVAEHLRGSGRGCDDLVYLIGRIGVGAGIIVNGAPLRGHDGYAGEVGHNVVDVSGPQCHCGKHGCVETYVGENALQELAGRGGPATAATVAAVFADAAAGEERAVAAVRTVAAALGRTIAGLVNVLNPERVLLGGSFTEVLRLAEDEMMQALDRYTMGDSRNAVQLCAPLLGEDSSLLGAAELAFAGLLTDPLLPR
ncbi:MAG: ROK family transcriptional regulator [Actinomycetota bacterium]|nr:ROK family transcriptional regulator [Actinomycetota bacterium]